MKAYSTSEAHDIPSIWKNDSGNWCVTNKNGDNFECKNILEAIRELLRNLRELLKKATFQTLNPTLRERMKDVEEISTADIAEIALLQAEENSEHINSIAKIIKEMCNEIKNAPNPMLQGEIMDKYTELLNVETAYKNQLFDKVLDNVVKDLKAQGYGYDEPINLVFEVRDAVPYVLIECDNGAYCKEFPIVCDEKVNPEELLEDFRDGQKAVNHTVKFEELQPKIHSYLEALSDFYVKALIASGLSDIAKDTDYKENPAPANTAIEMKDSDNKTVEDNDSFDEQDYEEIK